MFCNFYSIKAKELINDLSRIKNYKDKLRFIIKLGKENPKFNQDEKISKWKIIGCTSNLWLIPEYKDGKCYFKIDGDAILSTGVSVVIAKIYSGIKPDEVLAIDPKFLIEYGITQHLTMNRRNGLSRVCKQIKMYATVFKLVES